MNFITGFVSVAGFIWWVAIILITWYGFTEIWLKFNSTKECPKEVRTDLNGQVLDDDELLEGVTILRPIKGIDPGLKTCLESSLVQNYPVNKVQFLFCIEDPSDPAIPIVRQLIDQYHHLDFELLINDPTEENYFGPNPKINNLSKGYRRAKFDIIWIIDSNVWLNPGTLVRSVVSLKLSKDNGRKTSKPVKLVHHVPLAVAPCGVENGANPWWSNLGSKLDEMFLLTSHAKFYVFFNKASIAPCVNGKSNMYRRSDLDESVQFISQGKNKIINNKPNIAIEAQKFISSSKNSLGFFARYIGEDNMIGIAVLDNGRRTGMTGDVVVQPLARTNNSSTIKEYINRRVRWLRVRKYMVLAATLVEPTTESVVIGLFGAFGASNLFFHGRFKLLLFLVHELVWCSVDYTQYKMLLLNCDRDVFNTAGEPSFLSNKSEKLRFSNWIIIWVLRELLALPIWIKAMLGTEIDWRNKPFKIRPDLCAEEL